MSKDTTIAEYSWALQPLATLVPSQPIHQDSLHAVLQKVMPTAAEGMLWLAVYDLKTLMQRLVSIMQFLHAPQNWSYVLLLHSIATLYKFLHALSASKVHQKGLAKGTPRKNG